MMPLALYSLADDFKVTARVNVSTVEEARKIVSEHIQNSGYTNLRTIDDEDYSLRFVADPPKGRKGRNVASLDL